MKLGLGSVATFAAVLAAAVGLAGVGGAADAAKRTAKPKTLRLALKKNSKEVANAQSEYAAISANGRFVVYETTARLVKKDSPNDHDVYLYDRRTKRNKLVSVRSNGSPGNDVEAAAADISPNGRYICFGVEGALVAGDTNDIPDVYRHDRKTGKTIRVSVRNDGSQLAGVNDWSTLCGVANNGVVAFQTEGAFAANDTNNQRDIYVRNPAAGTTRRTTLDYQGNQIQSGGRAGKDSKIAISGNGNFVAFESFGSTVTQDPDFGNAVDSDVFVRNLGAGTTTRASLKSNGDEASDSQNAPSGIPSISANGRYVAFRSDSAFVAADTNNTYDIYVRDRKLGRTIRASVTSKGAQVTPPVVQNEWPEISPNGRFVVWDTSGNYGGGPDPNNYRDVYRRDLERKKTKLVSLKANGKRAEGNQLADVANRGWVSFQTMSKMTRQPDDGMDWDVFLRGPLRP